MEKEEFMKLFEWQGKESKKNRREDYSKILDAWEEYVKYIKEMANLMIFSIKSDFLKKFSKADFISPVLFVFFLDCSIPL